METTVTQDEARRLLASIAAVGALVSHGARPRAVARRGLPHHGPLGPCVAAVERWLAAGRCLSCGDATGVACCEFGSAA